MIDTSSKKLIALSKSDSQPIHLQIYHRFKQAIESQLLKIGDRIPSTRTLSSELNVSRGTVETAYSMLLGEGIFVSKGQAGTFVSASFAVDKKSNRTNSQNSAQSVSPAPQNQHIDFNTVSHVFLPGSPAYDAFPRKIWSRLGSNRMRSMSSNDMSLKDPLGYMPLRQSIATYLRLSRGVVCDPCQVFITTGYQGALDFLSKVLKLNGQAVWVEDPGYIFATTLLEDIGANIVRVPVDEDGMIVSQGIQKSPDAELAIVTPSHHSPLGMALSWSRRMQLLEWAGSNNSWVIEDDYDGEYRYSGYPLPSLKSLDQYDRVIYAGTFSKTLFPSLKLGYIVLPQSLVDVCTEKANLYQIGNPIISQLIVNDFIAEGHFSRHLNKMRSLYLHRREITSHSLSEILGQELEINAHKNGMHFVAKITSGHRDIDITTAFNQLGYNIHALSKWTTDPDHNGLIIGFTNVPNKKVADETARKLKNCFVENH